MDKNRGRDKIVSSFSFLIYDMKKLYCYNRWAFEEMCMKNGWNDDNVPSDAAFISICGSPACQEYVIREREFHYFEDERENILNLDFDDITSYREDIPDTEEACLGINHAQAEKAVEFIKKNLGKDFYVHCRAGKSRSQAFIRYILDMYDGVVCDFATRPENPPVSWNQFILGELKEQALISGETMRMDLLRSGIKSEAKINGKNGLIILEIEGLKDRVYQDFSGMWFIGEPGPLFDEYEIIPEIQKLLGTVRP